MTYIKAALEMGKIPEAKEQLSTFLTQRGSTAEGLYLMYWCEKLDHNMEAAEKWEKLAKLKDPNIASKVEIKPVDLSRMREEMRRARDEQGLSTPGGKADGAATGGAIDGGRPANNVQVAPSKGAAPTNGNNPAMTPAGDAPASNTAAGTVPASGSSSAAPSAETVPSPAKAGK